MAEKPDLHSQVLNLNCRKNPRKSPLLMQNTLQQPSFGEIMIDTWQGLRNEYVQKGLVYSQYGVITRHATKINLKTVDFEKFPKKCDVEKT